MLIIKYLNNFLLRLGNEMNADENSHKDQYSN